jgi:hypothetical protein
MSHLMDMSCGEESKVGEDLGVVEMLENARESDSPQGSY